MSSDIGDENASRQKRVLGKTEETRSPNSDMLQALSYDLHAIKLLEYSKQYDLCGLDHDVWTLADSISCVSRLSQDNMVSCYLCPARPTVEHT